METIDRLSYDEQKLLVETLLRQDYAIELISSEINDIESGLKQVDEGNYHQLKLLYDRLRIK
ncbi:antirepressor AbbA [Metabacillus litoralis]|uniref:antirepressor AbbA n=1 Tax=Metabacillus TaxID=2675233 RepID=UPI000EF595BE|nr:antirepressor AbbA [Metabacillus litoralis]MCM3160255.1 antirepressor AbbA [Metabacillus litoralis]MCM3408839.1 antirepressor AbbA [Metabacillus litoralis]